MRHCQKCVVPSICLVSTELTHAEFDGKHIAWGKTMFQDPQKALSLLDDRKYTKIVGHEQPDGILTNDGVVEAFGAERSVRSGVTDVTVTGLGPVYALIGE